MTCRLQLFLKGYFFKSVDIEISNYDDELNWEDNHAIREIELKAAAQKLRIGSMRAILTAGKEDEVFVVFQSKMNFYESDQNID